MGQIYFGTRDYMQYVEAPAVNMGMSKVGWGTTANYLNGGAYVRTSTSSHKEYDLVWNPTSREEIDKILAYADGIYGSGPIYWADPFQMDRNILPSYWASPFMGTDDGLNLIGTTTRPVVVATSANNLGYPTRGAQYNVVSGVGTRPEIWLPIPPGYSLWLGAHGTLNSGSASVYAQPTLGTQPSGTGFGVPLGTVVDPTRVTIEIQGNSNVNGATISIIGTGLITLSGMIAQLLPTGVVPLTGGFIPGQGHSGCSFASQPLVTGYSAVLDRVGASAKLIETQAWL